MGDWKNIRAYHPDTGILAHHSPNQRKGLFRREHFTAYTRAAFIDTVKVTNTVITLDVTVWCHREVHSSKRVRGIFVIAWMFLDLPKGAEVVQDLLPVHCCSRISTRCHIIANFVAEQ